MIAAVKRAVLEANLAKTGDKVVIAAGIPVSKPGTTNMIKTDVL